MIRVVLTGGPCGGKTSVLNYLRRRLGKKVITIPEIATLMLAGGFPIPDKDMPWSRTWEVMFEAAVFPTIRSFEDVQSLRSERPQVVVSDRGLPDVAAHSDQTVTEFCKRFGITEQVMMERYDVVVYLPSLALTHPSKYSRRQNGARYANISRARELEVRTRRVWARHKNKHIVSGSLRQRKRATMAIIKALLIKAQRGK
jgi:predicted ATPase